MLDAEAAVINTLTPLYPGIAISSELPIDAVLPRLRISRLGGTLDIYGHIDKPNIYVEAWANTKAEAWDLASTSLLAMINNLTGAQFSDGIITFVQPSNGISWAPDPDTLKPRYTYSVVLTTHPN